jgi:hypothetical protein
MTSASRSGKTRRTSASIESWGRLIAPRKCRSRLLLAGKAALKAAWPVYREQILSAFGRHFSDEELHFLVDRFSKLKDELEVEP